MQLKGIYRKFGQAFLLTLATLLLSGCLYGNGETYGDKPKNPAPSSSPSPNSNSSETDYYQIDPSYQCELNGKLISSYQDHIKVKSSGIFSLGDLCHSQSRIIDSKEISFSANQQLLIWRDLIYTLFVDPPTQVQLLTKPYFSYCKSEDSLSSPFDILIANETSNHLYLVQLRYFGAPTSSGFLITVMRNETASEDLFQTTGFNVNILKLPASRETDGSLQGTIQQKTFETKTHCRYF